MKQIIISLTLFTFLLKVEKSFSQSDTSKVKISVETITTNPAKVPTPVNGIPPQTPTVVEKKNDPNVKTKSLDPRFGLRLTPINIAWLRSSLDKIVDPVTGETTEFSAGDANLRFSGGFFVEVPISQNFAFVPGINFTTMGSTFSYVSKLNGVVTDKREDNLLIQYLQIPIMFKGYTGDLADGFRIYFQTGASLDIRLSSQVNGQKAKLNGDSYNSTTYLLNSNFLLGSGVEYDLGTSATLFVGIGYSRGLPAVTTDDFNKAWNGFSLKTDAISLEVGIKF